MCSTDVIVSTMVVISLLISPGTQFLGSVSKPESWAKGGTASTFSFILVAGNSSLILFHSKSHMVEYQCTYSIPDGSRDSHLLPAPTYVDLCPQIGHTLSHHLYLLYPLCLSLETLCFHFKIAHRLLGNSVSSPQILVHILQICWVSLSKDIFLLMCVEEKLFPLF